ncbi:MAG: hypothetical protein WC543_00145 [Candidatus Omnitrophota bacterium]
MVRGIISYENYFIKINDNSLKSCLFDLERNAYDTMVNIFSICFISEFNY